AASCLHPHATSCFRMPHSNPFSLGRDAPQLAAGTASATGESGIPWFRVPSVDGGSLWRVANSAWRETRPAGRWAFWRRVGVQQTVMADFFRGEGSGDCALTTRVRHYLQGGIVRAICNTRFKAVKEVNTPRIRILVAEDHPIVADGIIAVLAKAKDMEVV